MSARPDPQGEWESEADLDIESMPRFLSHPRPANDLRGQNPLMRRRKSIVPLVATLGLGLAVLGGAAYLLVAPPAPEVAVMAPATRSPVALKSEPKAEARSLAETIDARPAVVTGALRETMTASADPAVAIAAPVAAPVAAPAPPPEPAPREVARLEPPRIVPEPPPAVERPAPAPVPVPERPAPAPERAAPVDAAPRVSSAEAERALKRAETLLEQGDISAARLFLERAADGGSARASFRLAETYDPRVLQRWGARGIKGSPEKARDYYRQAQARGDAEAASRLAGLGAR
ncbi:sel1 repeat family protein [Salinarimonas soli]|uniref:Sel1 repeat family protein n=1 Tax=Salinarimonas soli TaxID=1638099 RepID=A0A5B2VUH3_9HYPH|nr:sel1 repeat family protein [Salinarimonas soli]KAA2242278.1 sel1 repeat family protein [Salinarimonas soli]